MPVIKSAKKKLRQDKKRQARNEKLKNLYKGLIKDSKKNPKEETIRITVSTIDKAAKHHLIHKNKAARLKSSLSKLAVKKTAPKPTNNANSKKKSK